MLILIIYLLEEDRLELGEGRMGLWKYVLFGFLIGGRVGYVSSYSICYK